MADGVLRDLKPLDERADAREDLAGLHPLDLSSEDVRELYRIAAEIAADEAVRAADTVLFTVPNELGVAYNARILETITIHIAPAIGWTPASAAARA